MANTIKHKRGTSTPTASDLVAGELAINTSNGDVFTKTDSNAVVQVGREVVDDTTPQLGGDLASNGNNINIADNDKLYFGDGDDGYLYFDSNNLILQEDSATGSLLLRGQNLRFQNPTNSNENWIEALNDGSGRTVRLFYNGTKKFETTSTGAEVSAGGILDVKNSGAQSELRLYCESSNAHYASIKAPPHSSFSGNITFTLPGTDGNANQVLKTDGAGNLGWVDQSSGGGSGISRAQATAVTLIFG